MLCQQRRSRSFCSSWPRVCAQAGELPPPRKFGPEQIEAWIKEAAGIHVLLTHSLFGDGILRRLPRRVSPAKPTSAPWRF